VNNDLRPVFPYIELISLIAQKLPTVNLHWLLADVGQMFLDEPSESPEVITHSGQDQIHQNDLIAEKNEKIEILMDLVTELRADKKEQQADKERLLADIEYLKRELAAIGEGKISA